MAVVMISAIKSVNEILNDNRPIGTVVEFENGDTQRAIVQPGDMYDFDVGVSICLMKEMMQVLTGVDGTKIYNDYIRKSLKNYYRKERARQKADKVEKEKRLARERYRQKRARTKRNRRIREQAEAILLAQKLAFEQTV